jgi:membrane-associated phospholipid phosphatase
MSIGMKWSISLALAIVAVVIAYAWLDRPLALLAHDELQRFPLFEHLTQIPEWMAPIVGLAVAGLGLWALAGRPLTRLETVIVLAAASLTVAQLLKEQLKIVFGRTWPETWVRDNPSFIHDGVFGFNPFHGGQAYSSFPSGHTTAICAVVSVLWICYPKFRAVYSLAVAAVAVGLIGANFHFLSDVIAGGFLGATTGWCTVVIWEVGAHPVRPRSEEGNVE